MPGWRTETMTLARSKATPYSDGDLLTGAQVTHIDDELVKALDGAGGGEYTPSSQIAIRGTEGLYVEDLTGTVTGVLDIDGALTVSSGGAIVAASGSDISAESGSTITVDAGAEQLVAGTVTVQDGGDVAVESGGDVTIESGATLTVDAGGQVAVSGLLQILDGASLSVSGSGNIANRVLDGADSDDTIGSDDADVVVLRAGVLTTNRTYTLGAGTNGHRLRIVNLGGTYTLNVAGVSVIGTMSLLYLTGYYWAMEVVYSAGAPGPGPDPSGWYLIDRVPVDA
jgi:hypothetical protein